MYNNVLLLGVSPYLHSKRTPHRTWYRSAWHHAGFHDTMNDKKDSWSLLEWTGPEKNTLLIDAVLLKVMLKHAAPAHPTMVTAPIMESLSRCGPLLHLSSIRGQGLWSHKTDEANDKVNPEVPCFPQGSPSVNFLNYVLTTLNIYTLATQFSWQLQIILVLSPSLVCYSIRFLIANWRKVVLILRLYFGEKSRCQRFK